MYAPNRKERDDLQQTIDFAFTRRLGAGYSIEGKKVEPKTLNEMIVPEHAWVVDVIKNGQTAWKNIEGDLPVDLLKAESAGRLLDLENAIGALEQGQSGTAGETRRG